MPPIASAIEPVSSTLQNNSQSSNPEAINWDAVITEDDKPLDNYVTEQHIGLLTDTLYDSWEHTVHHKEFIVAADVGLFSAPDTPPIVPDVFLSLGVRKPDDRRPKRNRSYFIWEMGKPPEVVIEIVSNQIGDEDTRKLVNYARLGIMYYAIFDPAYELSDEHLRLYVLRNRRYVEVADYWMPEVALGLTVWQGKHQGTEGHWLRWCDQNGSVIPTAAERAEQERARAERLAARLRELGIQDIDENPA